MSHGHFSTSGSPYRLDPKSAFYREQEEARREVEHTERAARWIAGKLGGQHYATRAEMERAVVWLVETMQGGPCDDAMRGTITRACVALWMGQVDRDAFYRPCVTRSESGIRFTAAA